MEEEEEEEEEEKRKLLAWSGTRRKTVGNRASRNADVDKGNPYDRSSAAAIYERSFGLPRWKTRRVFGTGHHHPPTARKSENFHRCGQNFPQPFSFLFPVFRNRILWSNPSSYPLDDATFVRTTKVECFLSIESFLTLGTMTKA